MGARTRVLVVDDDFEYRNAIADSLGHVGWEVRGAATGADALGLLRSWPPDVILLDLLLPTMDGWTFGPRPIVRRFFREFPSLSRQAPPTCTARRTNFRPRLRSPSHSSWMSSSRSSRDLWSREAQRARATGVSMTPRTSWER
jgi:hypothetical protein